MFRNKQRQAFIQLALCLLIKMIFVSMAEQQQIQLAEIGLRQRR